MNIPDQLFSLFSARIQQRDNSYVIELPENEVALGELQPGDTYRIAVFPSATRTESEPSREQEPNPERRREQSVPEPPVEEGDRIEVEIEDVGEQGDGIARVERGYIVFVPGTHVGDRVTIEVTDVRENFGFGEVVDDDQTVDHPDW